MKTLFVLLGATGTGKTELSIEIARRVGCPVISADSRQIYKDIPVGTAAPDRKQLLQVQHFFVGMLSLADYYSASRFEEETISLIEKLHKNHENILMCGGSMMYIDAVCKGIDDMPTVKEDIRKTLWEQFHSEGLLPILKELEESDPQHYATVDRQNYRRVIHAVEICRQTGKPYSSFRTQTVKQRPFRIVKTGLVRERADLFERISRRVDHMINNGMIDEALKVYPFRHLNSLNTVGYKELFDYFDGVCSLEEAVEKIKRNTRIYAKKQMTWFKNDADIKWFHPDNKEEIMSYISSFLLPL